MASNLTTTAFINDFADDLEKAMDGVHKDSFADVMEDSNRPESQGGRMPVDTGELRDSINVNGHTGVNGWRNGVRSAPIGGDLDGSYNAEHAPYLEFGTSKISPRAFARGAVLKWDEFFRKNARSVN